MATFLEIALGNLLVAAGLALPATLAGLWGRRPALTHALWLLVLVKLVTPPLVRYPIAWPVPTPLTVQKEIIAPTPSRSEPQDIDFADEELAVGESVVPNSPSPNTAGGADGTPSAPADPADPPIRSAAPELPAGTAAAPATNRGAEAQAASWTAADLVALTWLAGSLLWLSLALARLRRFQRLLRFAEPAPAAVQRIADTLAQRMGRRAPRVSLIQGNLSPMLWVWGRTPRLLVPVGLLARLPAEQLTTLLAHELAHWQRRDHRMRWLEMAVLALYWWCPLAWWARRELQQAEEECCDAWVVSLLPDSAKTYALALVETVDFLSGAPALVPLAASGLGHVRLLKRRLTMILQAKTPRSLTVTGLLAVAGIGALLLPMVPGWAQAPLAGGGPRTPGEPAAGGPVGSPRDAQIRQLHDEIKKIKSDMESFAKDLEQRHKALEHRATDLQKVMQHLAELQAAPPATSNGPGPGPRPGAVPFPGGPPFGGRGAGVRPGGPGGAGGPPGPGAPMAQRLNVIEHKLDMLLKELHEMRQEKQGPRGPMMPFGPKKGPKSPPPSPPGPISPPPGTGPTPPAGAPNPGPGRFPTQRFGETQVDPTTGDRPRQPDLPDDRANRAP